LTDPDPHTGPADLDPDPRPDPPFLHKNFHILKITSDVNQDPHGSALTRLLDPDPYLECGSRTRSKKKIIPKLTNKPE
jgi:hypothetical protein